MRIGLRALGLVVLVALAACASAAALKLQDITFAPALNVDPAVMRRLSSDVYVEDRRLGAGVEAQPGRRVGVHYIGWLPDGTQFQAHVKPNPPFEFELGAGRVIRGWDVGIRGMKPGGQRLLVIPPEQGYGRQSVGGVPPNSVLVFLVQVESVQ